MPRSPRWLVGKGKVITVQSEACRRVEVDPLGVPSPLYTPLTRVYTPLIFPKTAKKGEILFLCLLFLCLSIQASNVPDMVNI